MIELTVSKDRVTEGLARTISERIPDVPHLRALKHEMPRSHHAVTFLTALQAYSKCAAHIRGWMLKFCMLLLNNCKPLYSQPLPQTMLPLSSSAAAMQQQQRYGRAQARTCGRWRPRRPPGSQQQWRRGGPWRCSRRWWWRTGWAPGSPAPLGSAATAAAACAGPRRPAAPAQCGCWSGVSWVQLRPQHAQISSDQECRQCCLLRQQSSDPRKCNQLHQGAGP